MRHRPGFAACLAALAIAAVPAFAADPCDKNHYILDTPECLKATDLRSARAGHTATLLREGRVLVAGGIFDRQMDGPDAPVKPAAVHSVEIFDPATGEWTYAAPLTRGRRDHSAVLLGDGRVMVVGGETTFHHVALVGGTAEIYDPAADTWTPTAPMTMTQNRTHATATLLADGRVAVAGGGDMDGWDFGIEVFDPQANTWQRLGDLGRAIFLHTASRIAGGGLVLVGGIDNLDGETLASTLWVDPATTSRHAAPPMPEPRGGHAATTLPDGRILVTGGGSWPLDAPLRTTWVLDAEAREWRAVTPLQGEFVGHTATLLEDDSVLLVGGYRRMEGSWMRTGTAAVERWRENGETERLAPLANPRYGHTATRLPDGSVLVVGGWDAAHGRQASVERIAAPR